MKEFSAWEYLLIDAANNAPFGLDKVTFEERLAWANENLPGLDNSVIMSKEWKEKPLYVKAVQAIRKAQRGVPTGHLVGFDAVCSGMQLMSVLTGCMAGAKATGLVDQDRRADAYTDCTEIMSRILGRRLENMRSSVKTAVMTSLYGSKREPRNEFGEGTPELNAFYQAMYELAPGPCQLLDALINSWKPYALTHEWKMPDGFDVRIKVMQRTEATVSIDELNGKALTFAWYENQGTKRDVKNAANLVHSVDAYVLRSLVRRCSYDRTLMEEFFYSAEAELLLRNLHGFEHDPDMGGMHMPYYLEQYQRSSVADVAIIPHITSVRAVPSDLLRKLVVIVDSMLAHKPFDVITIHDDFKCHPNYMNFLRKHYRNILAEIAESNMLNDLLSQLYGTPIAINKLSNELGKVIRQSSYALC